MYCDRLYKQVLSITTSMIGHEHHNNYAKSCDRSCELPPPKPDDPFQLKCFFVMHAWLTAQQQCHTSLTDQASGASMSLSGPAFRSSLKRHSAAFLRMIGRTAPLVCMCTIEIKSTICIATAEQCATVTMVAERACLVNANLTLDVLEHHHVEL